MAPNLAAAQHAETQDMIISGELTDLEIAQTAQCSERTVRRHRANLSCFGSTTAPRGRRGRRPLVTFLMFTALCKHLLENLTKIWTIWSCLYGMSSGTFFHAGRKEGRCPPQISR